MNVIHKLLNWGWWFGISTGVFLAVLSCYWQGLEILAGVCCAFAFSCAVSGVALCLIGESNG